MSPGSPPRIIDVYLAGITALEQIVGLREQDWTRPTPCEGWTARDLLAHVGCVAEDYHHFLDAVIARRPAPLRLGDELARHNAQRLGQVAGESVESLASVFGSAARRFADRAPAHWGKTAYTVDGRDWTVGNYFGVCAVEWHVHAWDLAVGVGWCYEPTCADVLADAWRDGVPHLDLPAGEPWSALLRAAGRNTDQ